MSKPPETPQAAAFRLAAYYDREGQHLEVAEGVGDDTTADYARTCRETAKLLRELGADAAQTARPFQDRVREWIDHCFGPAIAADLVERSHRFIEEALELVQAAGTTRSEVQQLVAYVYARPVGDLRQEVGGVMNTLAAFCNAYRIDMAEAADAELARCWTKSDAIRAKQAAKPRHSPLPEAMPDAPAGAREDALAAKLREAIRADVDAVARHHRGRAAELRMMGKDTKAGAHDDLAAMAQVCIVTAQMAVNKALGVAVAAPAQAEGPQA